MNILFLTSRFPYPPFRGDKLKIYNLIKRLAARGHSIYLLSFIERSDERSYIESMKPYCRDIKIVHRPLILSILTCLRGIGSKNPFQVYYFSDNTFKKELERFFIAVKIDIVHVHLIRMAQYAVNISSTPKILDLTDAGSLYLQRFLQVTKSFFKKIFLKIESRRLIRYEKILEKFDINLVCSEIDREALLKNAPNSSIELLYNGVDLEYFVPPDVNNLSTESRIIYTGNMSYYPNRDGIHYFVVNIFPKILDQVPSAILYIVGQSPPVDIKELSSERIVVTGFVEDIRKEYLKSQVAIAPIRFGAGTLNKILEPMALGIPTVATKMAAQGLLVDHGEDILLADSDEDFVLYVVSLLRDSEKRKMISEHALKKVRMYYGWDSIVTHLEQVYTKMTDNYQIGQID